RAEYLFERGGGPAVDPADDVGAGLLVDEHRRVFGVGVVDDGGQGLEVDVDEVGRVLGERAARGDHEGDRVSDEADLVLGQGRARRLPALRPARGWAPSPYHRS